MTCHVGSLSFPFLSRSTAELFHVPSRAIYMISFDAPQSDCDEIFNPCFMEGRPEVLRLWNSIDHPVGWRDVGNWEGFSETLQGPTFSTVRGSLPGRPVECRKGAPGVAWCRHSFILSFFHCVSGQPSASTDFALVDSTNCRLKIFKTKNFRESQKSKT